MNIVDVEERRPYRPPSDDRGENVVRAAPQHGFDHRVVIERRGRARRNEYTVANDGNAVSHREDLVELVRDVDDATEQAIGFGSFNAEVGSSKTMTLASQVRTLAMATRCLSEVKDR